MSENSIPAELPDNFNELRKLAKDNGIASPPGTSKVDLVGALEAKRDGTEPPQAAPPEEKSKAAKKGGRQTIERTGENGAWWCPNCGHSQLAPIDTCRGCGATRDGDEVVV